MQKITPNLWFDTQAEEAASFYSSLFKDSKLGQIVRYDEATAAAAGGRAGSAMVVPFELAGQSFIGLNGGTQFAFTPAVSFFATLETEAEVDALWQELAAGASVLMPLGRYDWSKKYGWLNDRYGLSWQVALGNEAKTFEEAITPSLLFVGAQCGKAEEALRFYCSLFEGSSITGIMHHGAEAGEMVGTVQYAQFTLHGQTFMAMDSALEHDFGFSEAVSFIVNCETQAEIDHLWDALSAQPEAEQCGWLKDRFGLSWQLVPTALPKLLGGSDLARAQRVTQAMLGMKKLDIAALERAYHGEEVPA